MACPICDQKPMNCDCTPREREMWRELRELEDRPAIVITDAEREAVEWASKTLCVGWHDLAPEDKQRTRDAADTIRGLLERIGAT